MKPTGEEFCEIVDELAKNYILSSRFDQTWSQVVKFVLDLLAEQRHRNMES